MSSSLAGGDLINVNIPALDRPDRPCGIRVVKQSVSEMEDVYHREVADDGTETWRLSDKYRPGLNHHDDSDVMCLYEGYVTVTPLRMDMTRHQQIAKLAQVNWEGIG